MKAFFGKLLFVLAIVGIIALGNILIPAPSNESSSTAAVEKTTDDEPAADSPAETEEPAAELEPEEYTEEPTE